MFAALDQLRKVVRLLEKENEQFERDCKSKLRFQRKQEEYLRDDNEKLRMRVNDLNRPKVSVLAALEDKQAQLLSQVDTYQAKNELVVRSLEEIENDINKVSAKIEKKQEEIREKKKQEEVSDAELERLGFKRVLVPNGTEKSQNGNFRPYWVDKNGDKFKSRGARLVAVDTDKTGEVTIERSRDYKPDVKLKKKLAMLEGRVEQTLIKFNESLLVNKQLRAEIEHLRKERMQYDFIQAKLESQLNQKKADIALAIEATNVALETRDEANKKIAFYKTEIAKNQQEFDTAWREQDNMMEAEEKRRRQVKAKMEDELKKKKGNAEDDAAQKKQLEELTSKYETSKADVQRFEEAFSQLQEATNLKDIDELVQTFLEAEEQNFKLFKFLNELNLEQDKLQEEVKHIYAEAQDAASEDAAPDKKARDRKIEDQVAQIQARAEELAELEDEDSTKVREIIKIIKKLYDQLECSKLVNTQDSWVLTSFECSNSNTQDSFQCDVQTKNPIITENNTMYFLGIIEQRARDLMLRLINKEAGAVDEGERKHDLKLSCTCPLGNGPSWCVGAAKDFFAAPNLVAPKIDT